MPISFKLKGGGGFRKAKRVIPLIILFIIYFNTAVYVPAEENVQGEKGKTIYIIKKGDTLWAISKKQLKNPLLWPKIWKENPHIKKPNLIYAGDILIILIPPIPEAEEGEEAAAPPAEAKALPPPAEEIVPIRPAEGTVPLPPAEVTPPLPPAEGTIPLPAVEETAPLPPIEVTLPVLPRGEVFMVPVPSERKRVYVGMDKCRRCHLTQHTLWNETIHAKWRPSFTTPEKAKGARIECETCHGPGSLHVEDYKERLFITSFGPLSKDTKEEQNAVCMRCHNKSGLYYWDGGVHGRTLRCVDCHQVMENISRQYLLNRRSEKEICLKCHIQEKGKIFRSPHLSQDEAKMSCSTCHNPHGSDTPGLLTASSINENCYKCHPDKRGPYLFDHLPVQENCLLCHDPHASMNRPLLKVRQPFLCLECHTNLPTGLPLNVDPHNVLDPQSGYTFNRGCTNCHPMIHGSRHPSGARLQR